MERIAVFAALQWECSPILRQMRQVSRERVAAFSLWRGVTPGREVWLVKTGIGMERADRAARVMGDRGRFDLFLSTGCAGALAREMAPGDLAVATTVIGHVSGEHFATDAAHRERVRHAAAAAALRTTVGPVLCSPQALTTVAAKRAAAESGSVAVEMEGAPIAASAAQQGIPFLSVRTILDTADTELPYAGRFIDPQNGAMRSWALAGYLATHPGALPDLLAMQRMRAAAQRSLQRFFEAWMAEH